MRRLLFFVLAAVLAAPAAASDAALGNLLDARTLSGAASVFDGSRLLRPATVAVPVAVSTQGRSALRAPAPPRTAAPAPVLPQLAHGISDGYLGLYPESDFVLGTGRCASCNGPVEGKWYFLDDIIATPKVGQPAIVWIGSHELVEDAVLSDDGQSVRLKDGSSVPFSLVPRLRSNRSYYNPESLAYLKGRPLRMRGEFVEKDGARTFVARTLWPEEYGLDPAHMETAEAKDLHDIDALVAADKGGAQAPFETRLLWEKPGEGRDWDGRPVMGLMLNGAQGDDDESLGGHFSFFTGRVGPGGSMADWMFDNFYDMDSVSEKGIVASMVPMDKYMTDLNAGQSWYRPTYLLVMVMKDARVPLALQELFKKQYADYYAHRIRYDHTKEPCTGLIVDPLRKSGWGFPEQGKTPALIARVIAKLASINSKDPNQESQLYDVLREEPTHLYPRAAFDSLSGDALSLAGSYGAEPLGRTLSPLEKELQEDLQALVFVRLPQIPSSRKFGRDPAGGFWDYFHRVPLDRSKWVTVPTMPRPYPPPH